MDLRLVEIFCTVYEEESFSRAAKRMGISQPTVSGHIKTLETHLGYPLFDRLGREIRPTAAGRLLYRYGHKIVALKTAAKQAMDRFLDRLEGDLVLGASTIPGEYLLPSWICRFRQAYPGVDVRLRIHDTREVVDAVESGQVELGFVGARHARPQLEYRPFAEDELVLAAPASWTMPSLSLAELREQPLLVREDGSGTRLMLEQQLAEHGTGLKAFRIVAELGSTTAIKEGIKQGLGASVLSALAVEAEVRAGWIQRIPLREIRSLPRQFLTVINREHTASPLREAFLEFLMAENRAVA